MTYRGDDLVTLLVANSANSIARRYAAQAPRVFRIKMPLRERIRLCILPSAQGKIAFLAPDPLGTGPAGRQTLCTANHALGCAILLTHRNASV